MIDTTIIDWIGTISLLVAAFYFTGKKASNPKIRFLALIGYNIGAVCYMLLGIVFGTLGLIITQFFFILINMRGMINCYLEQKKYFIQKSIEDLKKEIEELDNDEIFSIECD
jgi:hydrogenase-4 membrane subunit HyfE